MLVHQQLQVSKPHVLAFMVKQIQPTSNYSHQISILERILRFRVKQYILTTTSKLEIKASEFTIILCSNPQTNTMMNYLRSKVDRIFETLRNAEIVIPYDFIVLKKKQHELFI